MGYLLGSIPFGLLLTRAAGLGDIREIGSGNIGATNVLRTGRKGLAAATLLLDGVEGRGGGPDRRPGRPDRCRRRRGGRRARPHASRSGWASGRQGRGDERSASWGLSWPVGAIACAAWLLFAAAFRYSSLAALLSVVVAAIAAWFLTDHRAAMLLTLLVPLVWARHHENIGRLLNGTSPRSASVAPGQRYADLQHLAAPGAKSLCSATSRTIHRDDDVLASVAGLMVCWRTRS